MSENTFSIHPKKFEIHPKRSMFEITKITYFDSALLSEVSPIENGGVYVETEAELDNVVEAPLLEACKILLRKGIRMVFSSANRNDVTSGFAHIALEYDSLSDTNKEIALRFGELGKIHGFILSTGVYIWIPIGSETTVGEVKQSAIRIAENFERKYTGDSRLAMVLDIHIGIDSRAEVFLTPIVWLMH